MESKILVTNVVAFLYLMLVFYIFYFFLAPLFLKKKKLTEFFGFSLIIVLIMPFFGYNLLFLTRALFEGSFHNFYLGYSLRMHMSGFYPVLTAAVFGSFFSVIISWFTTMNQKAELDRQKISAELQLLKSKLNPHFLFNTLNNIDSLIQSDPAKASSALIGLSGLMRYLTYETSDEYVTMAKETEYIRNFTELFRMRIRDPEDICLDISVDPDIWISPALFVPLLENAFRYCSFKEQKAPVRIDVSSKNGIVRFGISNCYENNLRKRDVSGHGLTDLKKRLELVYPGRHELLTSDKNGIYEVILTINTNAD